MTLKDNVAPASGDEGFVLSGYDISIDPERPAPDARRPSVGDAVTVTVTRASVSPQALSFIQGAKQAAPWLDATVALLHLDATAALTAPNGDSFTVRLDAHTPRKDPPLSVLGATALREAGTQKLRSAETARDFRAARHLYARSAAVAVDPLLVQQQEHEQKEEEGVSAGTSPTAATATAGACTAAGADVRAALATAAHANAALAALRSSDDLFVLAHSAAADAARGRPDAKTAFRRARAYCNLDMHVRAVEEIRLAARLAPADPAVKKEAAVIEAAWQKDVQTRRQAFAEVYNVMLNSPLFKDPMLGL